MEQNLVGYFGWQTRKTVDAPDWVNIINNNKQNNSISNLRLEGSVFLKNFDFFKFFDTLIPFEKIFPASFVVSKLLLQLPRFIENVLICVITVIKARDLLLILLQVITILAA